MRFRIALSELALELLVVVLVAKASELFIASGADKLLGINAVVEADGLAASGANHLVKLLVLAILVEVEAVEAIAIVTIAVAVVDVITAITVAITVAILVELVKVPSR